MSDNGPLGASFRDPSGYLFSRDGELYRQVNRAYAEDYNYLMESGLYDKLVKAGLLITHQRADVKPDNPSLAHVIIQPERVLFISYPYEWSFSQLKDAALATLSIQKRALKAGMSLKDASAYNIQFMDDRAVLIDTLSFQRYKEGETWVAYRQFCQHFLAPLALMSTRDVRLNQLLRVYIDGIPLDLASKLLPRRTLFNFGLLTHIHLHAQALLGFGNWFANRMRKGMGMSKQAMLGLVDNLESTVRKLNWNPTGTEWGNYYEITNYSEAAFENKKALVSEWIDRINPKTVWDLGANTGVFSRLASETGAYTVAFDIDPSAVEQNFLQVIAKREKNLLPLLIDLTNSSPAIGWNNRERGNLIDRGPVDVVLALALIHHLAIANNVPLTQIANFFHSICNWLVIEFIPKSDSQVQKLLRSRVDIFPNYTQDGFERIFSQQFLIREMVLVRESERYLYLMERC